MTAAESNYVVTEQELLATIEALHVFICYLLSVKQFNLVTDNRPNIFLQTQPILSRRQPRWSEYLQRFNFNWVHRSGRHNVVDPLSLNPNFKHLSALLAVTTRSSTGNIDKGLKGKRPVQELHSAPASNAPASRAGQKRKTGASTPATGANTTPLNTSKRQRFADSTTQPLSHERQSTDQQPSSAADDVSLIGDLTRAYAADPFFADDEKTADVAFAVGLWWKGDCNVVPNSADTKRLILQAFHDHPMAGHQGVTRTLKAIKSRLYWPDADTGTRGAKLCS